jgi:hypothetical protein
MKNMKRKLEMAMKHKVIFLVINSVVIHYFELGILLTFFLFVIV